MARVLVIFGTSDGHTAKIAARIGAALTRAGHTARVLKDDDASCNMGPAGYDAAIAAGSVNYGRFQKVLTEWIARHAAALNALPTAFFAVSGQAGDPAGLGEAEKAFIRPFLTRTGWIPRQIVHVAGAFPFTTYPWWKRWMMKLILMRGGKPCDTRVDYEYTDWDRLDRDVAAFAAGLK
ncbi:MAG: flavodoxin domain-containing protein [Rhodospirillaceae bacterium]|nr:flavodoxin domain-containing protein [Rhodospirillaceae bacterium]